MSCPSIYFIMTLSRLLLGAALLLCAAGSKVSLRAGESALDGISLEAAYSKFRAKYGVRTRDSVAYSERLAAFRAAHIRVRAQNSKIGRSWTAAVNRFSDYSHAEVNQMMGFRRVGKWWEASNHTGVFTQVQEKMQFRQSVDWSSRSSGKFIVDQGECGSCWAVAAIGALEVRAEISTEKVPQRLSYKELVDCVPNPHHCGGTGGCDGNTADLGYSYIVEHGLSASTHYGGHTQVTETCNSQSRTPAVKATRFVMLPENKYEPLMAAVQGGPVVVSVDGSPWMDYSHGVFDSCKKDVTINHAVLAMGYGYDSASQKDYWLVRNSWGEHWGEHGFIRVERHSEDIGDAGHCGWDYDPKQGNGCDGGPKQVPVCGMCGILSYSVYPDDVTEA